ncbi:hypothetical protein HNV12_06215 [Methanococcoides sp. SA1]|nr:hypothetical protein [Methanococcoides sp. SA1]
MVESLVSSYNSLYKWVKDENYLGWDIYDSLYSNRVKKMTFGSPYLKVAITQFNKYSPINLRSQLKIEKGVDAKGMALFMQSYAKMYNFTKDDRYLDDILECALYFKSNSLISIYGFDCWAHYFDYTTADKSTLSPNMPDVISTSNAIKGLVDGYSILNDQSLIEMAISAYGFLKNNLLRENKDGYKYLMYSPEDTQKMVINASALGLEAISKLIKINDNEEEMQVIAADLCSFVLDAQDLDGSWPYSVYTSGKKRVQTDFHQGFILDGLIEFYPISGNLKDKVYNSIMNGMQFYRSKQFNDEGVCHFRYPQFYPIDTHSQAQGVITFSKFGAFDPSSLDFSKKILDWTISNMQDNSGYFYAYDYKLFKSKIPYMRWCEAWMSLALATYLDSKGDN